MSPELPPGSFLGEKTLAHLRALRLQYSNADATLAAIATDVLKIERDFWADAIGFKGLAPALDFPVALPLVGRGAHVDQTASRMDSSKHRQ